MCGMKKALCLAVLIASEKLSAMTGQAINVDGGAVMV